MVNNESGAGPAASVATPAPAGPGLVLVVDNDPSSLELMSRYLTREGYQVVTARSGEEGLRQAREARPAAVLLDVEMPGMSGWDVLAALKADPDLAGIPVVMATMLDERTKGYALGVSDYLVKPIDRARLSAVLRRCRGPQTPGRVLVVEDDAANRELLARLAGKEGWTAAQAENGVAALKQVAEALPDLILLDLMMPVMDGFSFVRELRKNRAHRAIPVVVVTGKELSDVERRQLTESVQKIVQKGACSREELLGELGRQVAARPRPSGPG